MMLLFILLFSINSFDVENYLYFGCQDGKYLLLEQSNNRIDFVNYTENQVIDTIDNLSNYKAVGGSCKNSLKLGVFVPKTIDDKISEVKLYSFNDDQIFPIEILGKVENFEFYPPYLTYKVDGFFEKLNVKTGEKNNYCDISTIDNYHLNKTKNNLIYSVENGETGLKEIHTKDLRNCSGYKILDYDWEFVDHYGGLRENLLFYNSEENTFYLYEETFLLWEYVLEPMDELKKGKIFYDGSSVSLIFLTDDNRLYIKLQNLNRKVLVGENVDDFKVYDDAIVYRSIDGETDFINILDSDMSEAEKPEIISPKGVSTYSSLNPKIKFKLDNIQLLNYLAYEIRGLNVNLPEHWILDDEIFEENNYWYFYSQNLVDNVFLIIKLKVHDVFNRESEIDSEIFMINNSPLVNLVLKNSVNYSTEYTNSFNFLLDVENLTEYNINSIKIADSIENLELQNWSVYNGETIEINYDPAKIDPKTNLCSIYGKVTIEYDGVLYPTTFLHYGKIIYDEIPPIAPEITTEEVSFIAEPEFSWGEGDDDSSGIKHYIIGVLDEKNSVVYQKIVSKDVKSIVIDKTLKTGFYQFFVRSVDKAGNISEKRTITFEIKSKLNMIKNFNLENLNSLYETLTIDYKYDDMEYEIMILDGDGVVEEFLPISHNKVNVSNGVVTIELPKIFYKHQNTYIFKLRAYDGKNYSEWMEISRTANMEFYTPDIPYIINNLNDGEIDSSVYVFKYLPVESLTNSYIFYKIEMDDNFIEITDQESAVFTTLVENKRYSFSVSACDLSINICSEKNTLYAIYNEEEEAPSAPVIISPSPNQIYETMPITFKWTQSRDPEGGKVTYHYIISQFEDYSHTLVEEHYKLSLNKTVQYLKEGHYYFKVYSSDKKNKKSQERTREFDVVKEKLDNYGGCSFNP